jgi:hypothetical protein
VEREQVGQRLARMLAQRQAVDHGNPRLGRKLDDDLVRPGPRHDRVDEPLEVLRHVPHGFTGAQHDILGQVDGMAAELRHARLERDPGPERRPLEQHREGASAERHVGVPAVGPELGLQGGRPGEQEPYFIGGQVGRRNQIPTAKRHCYRDGHDRPPG